jgi:hypothetical protein
LTSKYGEKAVPSKLAAVSTVNNPNTQVRSRAFESSDKPQA